MMKLFGNFWTMGLEGDPLLYGSLWELRFRPAVSDQDLSFLSDPLSDLNKARLWEETGALSRLISAAAEGRRRQCGAQT